MTWTTLVPLILGWLALGPLTAVLTARAISARDAQAPSSVQREALVGYPDN
jgi:hypothetical protein